MNFKTRVCAAMLIGCLAVNGVTVSAKISDTALSGINGEMSFTGKTSPNGTVTFTIFRDDDAQEKTYAGISEFCAETDGSFEDSFRLNMSGDFILRLNDSDGYQDIPFSYSRTEDREAFVNRVKEAKGASEEETAAALAALFDSEDNKASLQTLNKAAYDGYAKLTSVEKAEFVKLFMKECSFDTLTETEFTKCFQEVYGLIVMNSKEEAEIQKALDILNPSFEETQWRNISDKGLTAWVLKYMKTNRPYRDIEALKKEYQMLNALYKINKANSAALTAQIAKYDELLGLASDTTVQGYLSSSSNSATKALLERLSSSPAYTAEMLKSAIADAMSSGGNGKGNGGGSGSGGSGGSMGAMSYVTVGDVENIESVTRPSEQKEIFSDIGQAEWAREAIEALAARNVISGYGDGTFAPNASVTREEFVKMATTAFDISCDEKIYPFLDVFETDWFYPYVNAAYTAGIVVGISENIFGVGKAITREDAAVILVRIAEYKGIKLPNIREYISFIDETTISGYAAEQIKTLYGAGVINGMEDGRFHPKDICTRAEAAKMIYGLN